MSSISESVKSRRDLLTDEEIVAIAADARTKPLAEVGRHLFPLLHHITALEDRQCDRCRFWVECAQTETAAHRGECTHAANRKAIQSINRHGEKAKVSSSLVTAFDWCCKGFEERVIDPNAAQCYRG